MLVIVTMPFSVGELVEVEPEKRRDQPDSKGGRAFVIAAENSVASYGVKYVVDNWCSLDVNEG
jgi:hypothetical protein